MTSNDVQFLKFFEWYRYGLGWP